MKQGSSNKSAPASGSKVLDRNQPSYERISRVEFISMTKLARQAHNPWRLALTRLISAMPLTIAPALTSRACNIEIEASLWENTPACQSPSDFMQRVSDPSPHNLEAAAKCIDLKRGQHVYHRVCAARRLPLRPTARRVFLLLGVHQHGDAGHDANSMRASFRNGLAHHTAPGVQRIG